MQPSVSLPRGGRQFTYVDIRGNVADAAGIEDPPAGVLAVARPLPTPRANAWCGIDEVCGACSGEASEEPSTTRSLIVSPPSERAPSNRRTLCAGATHKLSESGDVEFGDANEDFDIVGADSSRLLRMNEMEGKKYATTIAMNKCFDLETFSSQWRKKPLTISLACQDQKSR